ncbi:MAG: C39 family peptidase [Oscillospiraceae bacterium]|jgi:hypothetical protein|nr:C39 family peptidase [Oscillospiraceae bacterium]
MADDNRSGLSDAVEKGANTANAIRGAVKTGKAIAGAAKGAAAGPYGMAAGVLWANKKHIGKIVLAAAVLLLIPILFILMLPSMIFGWIGSLFGSGGGATPNMIMNDNAAIEQNIGEISSAVRAVLGEGMADVIIRIDADFASSGGDQLEIINPYADDLVYNGNLFISQYSAYKNEDYENISLTDMEDVLRRGKDQLYSFTRKEETRQTTVHNDETDEDETVSEKWMIYTVKYNGEAYFADSVFHLNDEQQQLAQNYAQNLSVFLDDGLYQYLSSSEYRIGPSYEGVVFTDGRTQVTYYNQLDNRWANIMYGKSSTIGQAGCGPTSMAIVISTLTGAAHDPIELSNWSVENGHRCEGNGSYHSLIPESAKAYGLAVEGCSVSEPQRVVDALSSGKLVVAIMSKGHFTKAGHFIVLRGVTSSGKILVADPASYSRSEQEWDLSIILNEARKNAGAGGPLWIIG